MGCPEEPELARGLTAEEHEAYFPIAAGAHQLGTKGPYGPAIDCVSCHENTASFEEFTCFSCHNQNQTPRLGEAHGRIPGYNPADVSCLACHPTGERGGQQGEHPSFPITPDDAHGNAVYEARLAEGETQCAGCHASDTDFSLTRCASCHALDTAPTIREQHASIGQRQFYVEEETACRQCHGTTPINTYMQPITNHVAIEFNHRTVRSCGDCHQATEPAPRDWTLDFAQTTCIDCHVPECTNANRAPCDP